MSPLIAMFYDERTCALTYVVADEAGGRAAIVDPVLDYEPTSDRRTQNSPSDDSDPSGRYDYDEPPALPR